MHFPPLQNRFPSIKNPNQTLFLGSYEVFKFIASAVDLFKSSVMDTQLSNTAKLNLQMFWPYCNNRLRLIKTGAIIKYTFWISYSYTLKSTLNSTQNQEEWISYTIKLNKL